MLRCLNFEPSFKLLSNSLSNPLRHKAIMAYGNDFACNRFTVQTFAWSLESVIQINLEHGTIAITNSIYSTLYQLY